MIRALRKKLSAIGSYLSPTAGARAERQRDRQGLPSSNPGIDRLAEEAVGWLGRAQDHSASADGGVARHYSLIDGWGPSYPETTGYIIPTLLDYARRTGVEEHRERARRMLDWLVSIQFPEGGFQAGTIGKKPLVPTIFNTGQILLGLAAGVREFGDEAYRAAMVRAADWLVEHQDPDGCWRRFASPFAKPGERTYDTHVAWGLMEAARGEPTKPYGEAALANVRWALARQTENGWFEACCLTDPARPLTHTLGYALRGIVEAYRFSGETAFLEAARRTADALLGAMDEDGSLPGRLDARWRGTVRWACLTGTAQVAACWFLLERLTGEGRYREAGRAANQYVRRTVRMDGPAETRGAVKGSFPVDGGYCTYQYPNWACKFFIDANLLEWTVMRQGENRPKGEPGPSADGDQG